MRKFVSVSVASAVFCLSLCVLVLTLQQQTAEPTVLVPQSPVIGQVWGYNGPMGPASWGGKCNAGRKQSPIDIPTDKAIYDYTFTQPTWEFDNGKQDPEILFNGFAVVVKHNYATLSFANQQWDLTRFQFHTPSEHKLNGVAFPAEMQMFHRNSAGRLLVVSWFFDEDAWAPAYIPQLADTFPETFDGAVEYNHPKPAPYQVEFNAFVELLMQKERKGHMFYTYEGSLSAPPCTENVIHVVMSELVGISTADLKKLQQIQGKNARPVQPLNGRKIYKSFANS